jgi:murein DD-endopeptidase MepM/ murein hydrolase activator NlpD
MRRVDRIRTERLRRGVVTAGCSFAVGALTAIGLTRYDGGSRQQGPPPVLNSGPAVAAPAEPSPIATAGPPRDEAIAPGERDLAMPVDGIDGDDLRDTFHEARAGSRPHEAIDIMAPRGTPVRAVRDGHIEKLFTSDAGGLTIYQFEPSGIYAYYYAHLDGYASGLREGQPVRRGEILGYVGSTGNASPDAPHLHFAIFRLGPERRWWDGLPLNPYPLLK